MLIKMAYSLCEVYDKQLNQYNAFTYIPKNEIKLEL